MSSWIHIFSKFTQEALLFETFVIFTLGVAYTAFWIIKKRRFGVSPNVIPSGMVKHYLGELIHDAQSLRTQLFGLLGQTGVGGSEKLSVTLAAGSASLTDLGPSVASGVSAAAERIASDPELSQKMQELEKKLQDQTGAMQALETEKTKLEQELANAKSGSSTPDGGGAPSGDLKKLQDKIKELEEKLMEYSVIEDDLANLKRLQQENAQLKAALEGKGGNAADVKAPAPSTPEAPKEEAAAKPEEKSEAKEEPPKEEPPKEEPPKEESTPIAEAEKKAAPTEEQKPDENFEGIVDKVEESLQSEEPQKTAAPEKKAEEKKPEEKKSDPAPVENLGKSDEDLLNEFEKMLNM